MRVATHRFTSRNHCWRNNRGASLVEFALISVLCIGLLGILIDYGFGIHLYTEMTSLTDEVARGIVVNYDSCSFSESEPIQDYLSDPVLKARLAAFSAKNHVTFKSRVTKTDLVLTSTAPLNCFMCGIFTHQRNFKAVSGAAFEKVSCGI